MWHPSQPKSPSSPWRYRQILITLLAFMALWLAGQHYLQVGRNAIARPTSSDFYKFALSAHRVDQGFSMYWLVPPKARIGDPCHRDTPESDVHFEHPQPGLLNLGGPTPCLGPNLNPPVFMVFMAPIARLPYQQAWWVWAAFSSACMVLSVWLLTGALAANTGQRVIWSIWGCALLFLQYPTLANFSLGQMGGVIFALLTSSWRMGASRRHIQAGIFLGLAISLKPFLILLMPALALTRHFRVLTTATLTIAGIATLGACVYGMDAYTQYIQVTKNITWTATNWNGSWYGFLDRYFISISNSDWPTSRGLSWLLATMCSALTAGVAGLHIRHRAKLSPRSGWNAIFVTGIPVTLLISPLGWVYYFPALALSLTIAWRNANQTKLIPNYRLLLLIPAAMNLVPIELQASPTLSHPAAWLGIDSWHFFTLFAFSLASMLPAYPAEDEK
jgi:hypothetical protein